MTPASKDLSILVTTIEHEIPHPLVALSRETAQAANDLVTRAGTTTVADAETMAQADDIVLETRQFLSTLEEQRRDLKAPVLALGKQIDEACKGVAEAVRNAQKRLQTRILDWQRAEQERAEARRRRLQSRIADLARFDVTVLPGEMDDLADAPKEVFLASVERAKQRYEDELQKRADLEREAQEQRELAELAGVEDRPSPEMPVTVPFAPTREEEREAVAAAEIPAAAPVPQSSSTTVRRQARVIIHDETKIPRAMGGKRLLVPDIAAIQAILKAGLEVPGCELVWDERPVAKRGS